MNLWRWVAASFSSVFKHEYHNNILKYSTTELTPWRQITQVHHRIYKSPPPAPILSQLDPLYILPANLPKIHSDPVLLSMPWSSEWPLSHQNPVYFPLLFYACHMSRPPHFSWFDLPNNICGWVQIMKFLIVQLPLFSCYFTLFDPNIFLGRCSQTASVYALPLMWETKFHTHTKQVAELWFCIFLSFMFLDNRREDKRLWTEW
jgi:hypothetical protein